MNVTALPVWRRHWRLFFRYSISNKENIVTIRDELRNIENYFLIQSYRFENKFALEINVEDDREEVGNYLIPKLSLQPIVENAIFHGLETKAEKRKGDNTDLYDRSGTGCCHIG